MKRFVRSENLVWFFIAAHLAIVLPLAWTLNVWLDEAWSLKTTADLSRVWNEAIYDERQAPLYFLLLAVWRTLSDSIFFARLFSIFCTSAAIFVFDKLARRILPATIGKYAAAFFAVHPYLIFVALEIRLYALTVLLSALLLIFWHKGFVEENKRARTWHAFIAVFGIYNYYYFGFLLAADALALVVSRRWQALKSYLLQMFAVAAAIVPLVFIIRGQFSENSSYARSAPSVVEGARLIWQHFLHFVLPAEAETIAVARLWLARIALVILLFLLIKTKTRIFSQTTAALASIVTVCSAFFLGIYYLLGATYLEIRHVAPLFVPASLLAASAAADVVPRRARLPLAALVAAFYAVSLFAIYAPLAKRGDWARIAAFIQANEQPNDRIIVFRAYDELPLGFYYRGANEIVLKGEPHAKFGAEDEPKTATRWRNQIAEIISQVPDNNERLWLVTEETCDDAKTAIECEPLEDFVRRHYVVERTEFFYKRKLRLLRRKKDG